MTHAYNTTACYVYTAACACLLCGSSTSEVDLLASAFYIMCLDIRVCSA